MDKHLSIYSWLKFFQTVITPTILFGLTKVLTTLNDIDWQSMVIDGELVDILSGDTAHKYLGRKLCGNLRSRNIFELAHRVQIAWMRFHKNRDILMDKNLSIYSRLFFFPSCDYANNFVRLDVLRDDQIANMFIGCGTTTNVSQHRWMGST